MNFQWVSNIDKPILLGFRANKLYTGVSDRQIASLASKP